jgi:type III secretory pathway lipoprotein EscJ
VKDNKFASLQSSSTIKWATLLICFIAITLSILWAVGTQPDTVRDDNLISDRVTLNRQAVEEKEEPLWMKYMPKSSIEKRDATRTGRQNELASMIETINGIKSARVVLSDDSKQGIGQPHRVMSACVMVEPSDGPLTTSTLDAIRTIVSDATSGLSVDQVNVINTTLGVVSVGVPPWERSKRSAKEIRSQVESAIGLVTATVSVEMKRENTITKYIPWMDDSIPSIRVSLPQTWIDKRSRQVGGEAIALESIKNLVVEVVPDSNVSIVTVPNKTNSSPIALAEESYVKQATMIFGLVALLVSGYASDRRRRKEEVVILRDFGTPEEEAIKILQMEHELAKRTIDSLDGVRKIDVLRAIVSSEETHTELPVVEVAKGKQLELTKCG